VTRDRLNEASRDELIDLVLASHTRLEEVEQQLRWFKNQLFGAKSERRLVEEDPSQLSLGESLATATDPEEKPATEVRGHARRRQNRPKEQEEPGLRFDDTVPVETTVASHPEIEGLTADEFEVISEKKTYQLAQRPASYVVLETVRRVVKRRDTGEISCPLAPHSVLPGSYADVSLLAGMIVDKFKYHLPLYRQHQRIQAAGITVSRSSLTNWTHDALDLLEPIYLAQLTSILNSSVLAMDETPIRAGRKSKGKMKTGYFWPLYGDQQEVAFPFASSRAKREAEMILGSFCGTLLTDGYTAYEGYTEARDGIVHALCWAHTRRGFVQAENVEPRRSKQAIEKIGLLYEIEEEIRSKKLEAEAKQEQRGSRSMPIVAKFFEWLKHEMAESALLPTNPFTKAANYALARQKGLEVFLSNPDVAIDTNHLERALRPIPMGRKNWLFCWTEVGAEKVGWAQSLIATCGLHDVDPYVYLVDVLQRVDTHPFERVEELTPRLWKKHFANDPMRSRLDQSTA
jgi:transposase